MWHQLGAAPLTTALVLISSLVAAQPAEIRFNGTDGGRLANSGAATTVFRGAPAASSGTAMVAAGGTTVFHGAPTGNGTPAATGPAAAAAPPPPTSAGR